MLDPTRRAPCLRRTGLIDTEEVTGSNRAPGGEGDTIELLRNTVEVLQRSLDALRKVKACRI